MSTRRSLVCTALILTAACGTGGTETTGALTAGTAAPTATQAPAPTAEPTPEPTPLATAQPIVTQEPPATEPAETPRPTPIGSPRATLASETDEVEGARGTYCWTPDDREAGTCVDALPVDPDEVLEVRRGETLTLAFDHPHAPKSIRMHRYDTPFEDDAVEEVEVPDENPARFTADFPEGTSWLSVATFWEEGDAYYSFEVEVR